MLRYCSWEKWTVKESTKERGLDWEKLVTIASFERVHNRSWIFFLPWYYWSFTCVYQLYVGIYNLLQAQLLLKKSSMYQKIEQALQRSHIFRPNGSLPQTTVDCEQVSCLHRDHAVNNLRFFNIFYGFKASTFALSVNLLDRMLGKVKVSTGVHCHLLQC